jgi:glycosyltransferase involved in cell wall biosynthesis/GT2 family glycosyltransferase
MRVSVVINTYNRGKSLRTTLGALRYQTHDAFEVVVVKGPCTDDTDAVLREFAGMVRVAECAEVHLSKSRNLGIDAASGEVVAFIDDDAIPEPAWLAELVAAYDAEHVGGAGGVVYDHTGFALQYQYSVCDRVGGNSFDVKPPFDQYTCRGADPFVYLQGTNASFRRKCLVEIGGFDEEIEYYLDEVEVCMRVIDAGYELRPLANAAVHHKYLASHLRNHKRAVFNPYAVVKNRFNFALQNGRRTRTLQEVLRILMHYSELVRAGGDDHYESGVFTLEQRDFYMKQVDHGIQVGLERGLQGARHFREIPPPREEQFLPFPAHRPRDKRLTICFLSQEYPPEDFGGIGRYTSDLAAGCAARGHEVHVVTKSPDQSRVDFEDGVWMHRLAATSRAAAEGRGVALLPNLEVVASVYAEVCRIHERGNVDVVVCPLWLCEGLLCSLDPRFPTVLTLMTSLRTIAAMHPSWNEVAHTRQLMALEGVTARAAKHVHAISAAILEKVRQDYAVGAANAVVAPLGIRDRSDEFRSRRSTDDRRLRVLFVGRMERRKGVDLLLRAAEKIIADHAHVDFILAGKDTPNTETGGTYREAFVREHAKHPALLERVRFTGAVSDAELYQLYADADIFCLPSRYESFGLVLLEAMMFGKPVVGCNTGGMREIVEVGGNGLLAEPDDAVSLEQCLRRLIDNDDERRRFGERSRALFVEKFSSGIMVENALQFYHAVTAAHPPMQATNASEDRKKLLEEFAKIIAGATGVTALQAQRLATGLLTPTVATAVNNVPQPRLGRLRARIKAIPPLAKLARYLKRAVYLPWAFHKFQATFMEMQHTLRMIMQDQHLETRALVERRNNELRRVVMQEIEELRGLIREQRRSDVLPDRRDAA